MFGICKRFGGRPLPVYKARLTNTSCDDEAEQQGDHEQDLPERRGRVPAPEPLKQGVWAEPLGLACRVAHPVSPHYVT